MSTPPSLESLNAAISVLAQQVTQLNIQVNPTPEANFAPFEIRNPTTGHIAQVSHEDPLALLKTINDYDGNPNLLNHWLNKARRINQIFFPTDSDTQQKQGHYYTFLLGLESKIIGPAQEVLAKNNYEANFSLMEKLLIEAFGEKKKIEHLLYEIITAEQHGKSNHEFYEYITTRLNQLISSTILKYGNQNANPLIEQYKMQAVSAYLRGLNGINGLIITGYDPKTLEEAYHHYQQEIIKEDHPTNRITIFNNKDKIKDFSINNKVLYTNNDNTNEISNRFKDNNTVLSYKNFNNFKDNNEVLSNENFNHFKDNEVLNNENFNHFKDNNEVLNNENFNHINCEIYNNYNNNEKSNHSNNSNMRTNSSSNNFSVIES
ncbi:probable cyclin-dependent serine/threonine-protein kinase DDB_G0292550 [Toxorhynchites rutilus septentrionalis]|uniref:probable cyclin-dependent serine/threonine-protein kinase DDB_G0292550 n=1 Tax=Toxorhynchites rutilus septentrionalis TaxID=329112 RepID=UPI00247A0564|nr:probable cyclin-dependent serine/threonine-protein kinase DDB_G0292550 [Toxorhynchites rutilus septentrionalis]